jgi:hypothetical protein
MSIIVNPLSSAGTDVPTAVLSVATTGRVGSVGTLRSEQALIAAAATRPANRKTNECLFIETSEWDARKVQRHAHPEVRLGSAL